MSNTLALFLWPALGGLVALGLVGVRKVYVQIVGGK